MKGLNEALKTVAAIISIIVAVLSIIEKAFENVDSNGE